MRLARAGAAGSCAPGRWAASGDVVGSIGAEAQPAEAAATQGARALRDGEVVILRIKPHPVYVLLSSLGWALALAALGVPIYLLAQQAWSPVSAGRVAMAAFALLCARVVWQALDWWAKDYVLTDRRVIRVTGVIRRARFEAPLRNIQHVDLTQSVMERLFALGTLGFATSGTAFTEAHWVSVEKPQETLRVVREAIDRYGRG